MSVIRDQSAWLLPSRFSPFPVAGELELVGGRISFTIDVGADEDGLDWLAAQLGFDGLRGRLEAGERVVAFDHPVADCTVSWPLTGGGAQMIVDAPDRRWIVTHDPPPGGRIEQALNLFRGQRRAREWKRALAEAEAG